MIVSLSPYSGPVRCFSLPLLGFLIPAFFGALLGAAFPRAALPALLPPILAPAMTPAVTPALLSALAAALTNLLLLFGIVISCSLECRDLVRKATVLQRRLRG